MSDLLEEVKETLRDQKVNKILKITSLGIFITGIILVIFLGFNSWYNNKIREENEADGVLLTKLVARINKKGQKEELMTQLEGLAKKTSAYGALANFYLASLSLLDNQENKALYYYQRLSEGSYDKFFKDYATLVLLNAKLQFNPDLSEEVQKELEIKLTEQKIFRDGLLLLQISLNQDKKALEELQLYKNNDSLNFIKNLLNARFNSSN
jgi:predicted negative regulator of RcsB-dependent stress response